MNEADQQLKLKWIGKFDLQLATAKTAETFCNGPVTSERVVLTLYNAWVSIPTTINTSSTLKEVLVLVRVLLPDGIEWNQAIPFV